MTYNNQHDESHVRFYCKIHKKHIYFFTRDVALTGYHCWDCLKQKNDADWKSSYKKEEE